MQSRALLGFAGTPEFAVPSLQALLDGPHAVAWVLTQPDRPAGRGRRVTSSPIKQIALGAGLPLAQPASLRDPAVVAGLPRPDLVVVVAYGLLLPRWFRDWPRLGCVNVHASLLPRWRGAAPIQRALLAGDTTTGVSLMQIVARLDAGPVFARTSVPVLPGETAGELHDRLAGLGARLLADSLDDVLAARTDPVPQREADATYAHKITKAEALLDWQQPARQLECQVRAFNPWPVAEGLLTDQRRLRIWRAASLAAPAQAPAGRIVAATATGIDVATGSGQLRLLEVQAPGARVLSARDYLNAHSLAGVHFVSP
jgi:methionyl-tRNA formyltransferase